MFGRYLDFKIYNWFSIYYANVKISSRDLGTYARGRDRQ